MNFQLDGHPEEAVIVKKTIEAAPVPESQQERQTIAWYHFVIHFWRIVRGYTGNDVNRLKEAGVRRVEVKNEVAEAETLQKIASAEHEFAEAELKRQEAALKRAEAERMRADAEAIRLRAVAESRERVLDAMSRFRQQGGDIPVDLEQLENLVRQGYLRFPDDPEIADAVKQLPKTPES